MVSSLLILTPGITAGKVPDLELTNTTIEEQVMGRMKKISDKEVWAMVARVMAFEAESLSEEVFISDGLDFNMDESLAWALAPAPTKLPASLPVPVSGSRLISIRVPERVIHAFKAESAKTGRPYQTMMNRALKTVAESFV
jgi:uncharacterized protein (DUF4415 family)